MDYKEKYEAALERAKHIHEVINDVGKKDIEVIFPELAESEDERTRKMLITRLRDADELTDELRGWLLAWLEKQKDETKKETPAWMPKFLDELRTKSYLDWDEHKDMEGKVLAIIRWIAPNYFHEKQKEQKSGHYLSEKDVFAVMTKLTNLSFSELIPINSDEYKKIQEITSDVRRLLDYPVEQKPAEWSEEDDDFVNYFERLLDFGYENDPNGFGKLCQGAKQWLRYRIKSLRPQPKQEWSEEDEKTINMVIETLEHENYLILADKLKSLRPQPKREWGEEDEKQIAQIERIVKNAGCAKMLQDKIHNWLKFLRPSCKPSEELMGCLERVMAFKHPEPEDIKGCEELLEQLKKLI